VHFVGLFFPSIMKMHGPKTKTFGRFEGTGVGVKLEWSFLKMVLINTTRVGKGTGMCVKKCSVVQNTWSIKVSLFQAVNF